jgi:actin-like protein 6A
MFETFNAPAIFISKDAVLSCFASGKTTGIVVDCGASGTVVTPVSDGWAETAAISRTFIGGRAMDAYTLNHISNQLAQQHLPPLRALYQLTKTVDVNTGLVLSQSNSRIVNIHPSYDAHMLLEVARDMKESVCRTADSNACMQSDGGGDPRYVNIPLIPYVLPDGTLLDVGPERYHPTEMLFDPTIWQRLAPSPQLLELGLHPSSPGSLPSSLDPIEKMAIDSLLRYSTPLPPPLAL